MASTKLLNFIAKYGRNILFDIRELRNKGLSHQQIATKYNIDPGNWSKLYKEFFEDKCEIRPHVIETLHIINTIEREKISESRGATARILQLTGSGSGDPDKAR